MDMDHGFPGRLETAIDDLPVVSIGVKAGTSGKTLAEHAIE